MPQPDPPHFSYTDPQGRQWQPYVVGYSSDGADGLPARYSFTVYATSLAHAELVVADICASASLLGRLVGAVR